MPISATELTQRVFDAINDRDLDAFLALVDPEVEFNSLVAEADARTFHGHEGVRQWWETVLPALGGLRFENEEIRELPDDLVLVKIRVVGEAGGVSIEQTMWQAARRRGDRAIWWRVGRTEDEVIEAAQAASSGD